MSYLTNFLQRLLFVLIFNTTLLYSATCVDIPSLNNIIEDASYDVTVNRSGRNAVNYYKFQTAVDGTLSMKVDKYGYQENVKFSDDRCDGNQVYQVDDNNNVNETFTISANTTYYIKIKEKNGDNKLKFTLNLSFTKSLPYGGEADNVCYGESTTDGDKTTTPISSLEDNLQEVIVYFDTSSLFSIPFFNPGIDDCSVDDGAKSTNCEEHSDENTFGPVSMFNNGGWTFNLSTVSTNENRSISTYDGGSFFDKIADLFSSQGALKATYVKNGLLYQGTIKSCGEDPLPMLIEDPNFEECGVFPSALNTWDVINPGNGDDVIFADTIYANGGINGTINCSDTIGGTEEACNVGELTMDPPTLPSFIDSTLTSAYTASGTETDLQYGLVTVSDNASVTFSATTTYTDSTKQVMLMKSLDIGDSATVTFTAGDYYIANWTSQASLKVRTTGEVRLFIDSDMTLTQNHIDFNYDGGAGLASNMLIFINGNFEFASNGGGDIQNMTAYVYTNGTFTANHNTANSSFKGAVSAKGAISLNNNQQYIYDGDSLESSGFGSCDGTYGCSKPHTFELRKNLVLTGDLIAIGNSNICADIDTDGTCDTNQEKRNDTANIIHINSASSSAVSSEPSNLENTSAANLSLPSGATVVWAGLYWQGAVWDINLDHTSRTGGSNIAIENGEDGQARKALADKIKFKVPGGGYSDITADEHYYFFVKVNSNANSDYQGVSNRYEEHYQSFKDVTDLVVTAGEGNYWVANIQSTVGKLWYPGSESAWSLQIIYNDPSGEPRSISVTDGYVGLYDNGSAGDNYANAINTINDNNDCLLGGSNTGAYDNEISFDVGGFLTPSSSGFQTDMSIFVTESDPDGAGSNETLTITKKDGSISNIDGPGAWNYEITLKDGVTNNDDRTPNYIYPIGMTIKNYNQTDILSTEQTSTTVTFRTGSDRLMLGVVGFATDLRKPKLCYDYSYSQYDTFLTEENNGSKAPYITTTVNTASPIDVQLYVQNIEDSDIIASGMYISVLDINTSQATYVSGTTQISAPGSTIVNPVSESTINSDNAYIKDIPVGDLDSLQYFYTYYQLDPTQADIEMPIYARVDYNITFPLDNAGDTITIPYQVYLNSDIPLCSNNSYSYQPTYGVFNIVHNDYYNSTTQFYNLPTQVTSREGNFKVIALDATNQDQLQGLSTVVAVELIAAEGFHITDAQCQDPTKSISDRVWLSFDNNTSFTMFDQAAIQNSISRGMTTLTSSSEFYQNARENAAFRVSYNLTNDGNSSLVQADLQANGNYIINFTELVQGLSTCENDCGNGSEITSTQLAQCMECLYGNNTKYVCSRDNFSIRPEALSVKIYDNNQTIALPKLEIDSTISDVITPTANTLNLAAGYNYTVEINATNHLNHNSSVGYTKTINSTSSDSSEYTWEPRNGRVVSGCNDLNNSDIDMTFSNGEASRQVSLAQVGDYRLNARDVTWTSVDSNSTYMTHHTGAYFSTAKDCIQNSDITQIVNVSAGTAAPLIGCNISSSHDNSLNAPNNNLKYRDYNITFHPAKFDLTTIVPSIGLNNAALGATSYIYMSDMSQDQNMSFHLNGNIVAQGFDSGVLSNFVTACYAEDLNLTLNKSNISGNVAYQYRFNDDPVDDLNNSATPILVTDSNFTKATAGSLPTVFNLNFARTPNNAQNPETIAFTNYEVNCSLSANCRYVAGVESGVLVSAEAGGSVDINQSIRHYYGRTHAPRQQFIYPKGLTTSDPAIAFIYYEVYCSGTGCDKTLLQDGLTSNTTDDPRWFVNTQHTSGYGNANTIKQKNSLNIVTATNASGNAPDSTNLVYTGGKGYPYRTTMENNASNWLIYDKYNPGVIANEFDVEFLKSSSNWAGVHETDNNTKDTASDKTNKRSMW